MTGKRIKDKNVSKPVADAISTKTELSTFKTLNVFDITDLEQKANTAPKTCMIDSKNIDLPTTKIIKDKH